jgi:hypothetical protein
MDSHIDLETFDIQKFAESLVRDGSEGIKWERKKLEWILQEQAEEREKREAQAA